MVVAGSIWLWSDLDIGGWLWSLMDGAGRFCIFLVCLGPAIDCSGRF